VKRGIIATWGVGLVVALLLKSVLRLAPMALEPWLDGSMTTLQKGLFVGFLLFNAYGEGYRGFQLRYAPRVVSRAFYLADHPRLLHVVLALPFCMSLFHAKRRQMIVSWTFLLGLVGVVALVRLVPQPWRGIIDGGVVVGLVWGIVAVIVLWIKGLRGSPPATFDIPDVTTPVSEPT
jgi:hypothetical protein